MTSNLLLGNPRSSCRPPFAQVLGWWFGYPGQAPLHTMHGSQMWGFGSQKHRSNCQKVNLKTHAPLKPPTKSNSDWIIEKRKIRRMANAAYPGCGITGRSPEPRSHPENKQTIGRSLQYIVGQKLWFCLFVLCAHAYIQIIQEYYIIICGDLKRIKDMQIYCSRRYMQ